MKRSICILSITFLICTISIIIGSCAIGFFTKPEPANLNLKFVIPTAFYVLITIVWIGALITGFRTFIRSMEKRLFQSIFITLLFFFLLFAVSVISIFIVYAIHQNKSFLDIMAEFFSSMNLRSEGYLGLLAVLLSFGSMLAVLSIVIQIVRRKVRIKQKRMIGIVLSISAIAVIIAIEEALYKMMKGIISLFSIRKNFDVISALIVLIICAIIHYNMREKRYN